MQILGNRSGVIAQWVSVIVGSFAIWSTWPTSEPGAVPMQGVASVRPYLLPVLFASAIVLAAVLHLIASRKGRGDDVRPESDPHGECNKKIQRSEEGAFIASEGRKRAETENEVLKKSLAESESYNKHWKKEVDRVQSHYSEQVRLREEEAARKGGRVGELEQQLRVSQDTVENLKERLSAPKGWLKLKKVRYIATVPDPTNLSLSEAGALPEKDLTQFFEDKFFEDGKLIIPPGLYRKLFGKQNDPLPGFPKVLEVRFVHAGSEMSVLLPENMSVTLPFPYSMTPERND